MTIYIICHKDLPYYTPPDGSKIIWLSAKPPPKMSDIEVIEGYAFFDNPEKLHATYAGSLGTMAILKILQHGYRTPHTTIWQYRKFLSRALLGSPVTSFGATRLVKPDEAARTIIPDPEAALPPRDFLIQSPWTISSAVGQYARNHKILDFLRFSTLLIEQGFLTDQEAGQFVTLPYLAIGGVELGTYPTDWWVGAYGATLAAALAFMDRFGPSQPDDPYQWRAIGFLQERFGSYKVVERLVEDKRRPDDPAYFGTINVITDGDRITGGT
jgi:hypothetical protein